MACLENVCTRHSCGWGQFSNEVIKVCPRCGDRVISFFDEDPYENESPSGDDYSILDDED